MSKKDNTLLWIAGAGILGWVLAPKALKEQITGGIPGIGIDLSGLLGGGIGGGGLLSGVLPDISDLPDVGGLLGDVTGEIPSENNIIDTIKAAATEVFSDLPMPVPPEPVNIVDAIKDTVKEALGGYKGGVLGPGQLQQMLDDALALMRGAGETGGKIETKTPNPWELFTELHPVVQNVVAGVAGVGGVYGAVKTIQAVAPAGKTAMQAIADLFKTTITKTKTGVIPKNIFKAPAGINPKLWAQWLKTSEGLSKGILKGGGGLFGVGGLALGLQEFLFSPRPTTDIISDPRAIFTGSGQFVGFKPYDYTSEHMGVLEPKIVSEGAFTRPSFPPTAIAPKPFEPKKTKKTYGKPYERTEENKEARLKLGVIMGH